ncbi:MAG TPA: hypothetical protein PLW99_02955 [Candidatus Paceibacterota bacterium]|nr:MAG: hypothetical protein B7X03_01735 [Parcubacteria group bacterium 21-58-10]HQT83081.1 hypothetical protein [Candidatus Paceibacterota bacterium]
MKEYTSIIVIVAVTVLIALWVVDTRTAPAPAGQACSLEAKLCPDGSAVGRVGPDCEFAPCPTATTTPSGTPPGTSGVRGTVSLGPTCPVMRNPPDPQCADKPYATAIAVYRTGSAKPLLIGNSDATGAFALPLAPGSYTLNAGGGAALPRCAPVVVTVAAGAYATTSISCDSGIR